MQEAPLIRRRLMALYKCALTDWLIEAKHDLAQLKQWLMEVWGDLKQTIVDAQ